MPIPTPFSRTNPPRIGERVLMRGGTLPGVYGTVSELDLARGVAGLFPVEMLCRQTEPLEVALTDLETAPQHPPDYWDELAAEERAIERAANVQNRTPGS